VRLAPRNAVYRHLLAEQLHRAGRRREAERQYQLGGDLGPYEEKSLQTTRRRFGEA
jgi:hypothetical protein